MSDWNAAIEAAAGAVRQRGNFGDYRREELTADFGQPRFDFMNEAITAIRALRSTPPPAGDITQEQARAMRAALSKVVNHWDDRHPKDLAQARTALAGVPQ